MSSSQDRGNVNYRPMWWLYGTGFALFIIGLFVLSTNLSSNAAPSWQSDVWLFLVEMLSIFAFLAVPGALLAFRHPWGAA
ncbi:MAG: hypothetical protein ACXVCX_01530 [Ktedonobacterales bacterium]